MTQKFPVLDGMRGVAALAVTLHHIRQAGLAPKGMFISGYLAVDLFFVLSGFVIAHAYDTRIGRSITPAHFIIMRFIRFWPLIFLGVCFGALQIILFDGPLSKEIGDTALPIAFSLNSLILPYLYGEGNRMFPTNPPEWSLFYELIINSLYAVLFRWISPRVLLVLVAISGLGLAITIAHYHAAGFGWAKGELSLGMIRVTFSFFAGVLIRRHLQVLSNIVPKWPMYSVLALTFLVLLFPFRLSGLYDILVVIVVSPLLVVAGSQSIEGEGNGIRVAKWLGDISYPLYAIHAPVIFAASTLAPASSIGKWLLGLAVFLFAVSLSPMMQRFFDIPTRAALSRLLMLQSARAS